MRVAAYAAAASNPAIASKSLRVFVGAEELLLEDVVVVLPPTSSNRSLVCWNATEDSFSFLSFDVPQLNNGNVLSSFIRTRRYSFIARKEVRNAPANDVARDEAEEVEVILLRLFWCAVTRKYTSRASATIARSFSLPYRSYGIFVGLRFVS